jgi:ligand-binding sensor domain-containing protein/signal transduction histidine kinase
MNPQRFCHRLILYALLFGLGAGATLSASAQAQPGNEPAKQSATDAFGHQAWTSENGLPQNSVHQILQTHDGYLWVATEGGAGRFNGTQFTIFNQESDPAFTSNDACCLAEDRRGALWIGTADGLLRYVGGKFHRYTTADGLPSSVILALAPADDASLLVLAGGGVAKFDGQRFTSLTASASALGSGPEGHVWIATAAGVQSYSAGHLSPMQLPPMQLPSMPAEPIEGLGSLKDGSEWVRTRTALHVWTHNLLHSWHTGRELPGTRVQSFLEDSRGDLWVGTDRGLVLLHSAAPSDSTRLEILPLIGAASILTLFEDKEHDLWVGTDTAGLHVLRPQKFHTLSQLLGKAITAITQTTDGTAWLGSKDEGLFRYENGTTTQLSIKDGLLSNVVLSLAAPKDGSLWIGTPDGLNHLQGRKLTSYTSADGLPDDFIRSIFSDTDGSLWVGTRRGLAHWKDGRFTVLSREDGFKSNLIGAMLRSSSNDLWVGTLDGLVRIREGKLTLFTRDQGLSGNVITSLFEDANHTLWVGTKDNGLSRYAGDGFLPVRAANIPREIDAIVQDHHGYLWLASSNGILRVLASDLIACGDTSTCNPRITAYGSSDGIPAEETSSSGHPGAWRMANGDLWFATRKGVAIINPADLREDRTPLPVVVERFTVDDIEWQLTGAEISIPPGHVRYAFEYAALSFVSPSRVRYRYTLQGFDKQWTQAGSRRNAYYTNLPPGRYRFRVQAAGEDGVWSDAGGEVAFVIKSPFYRTLWFSALVALLLIGIAMGIYRLRVRAIRSQFDAILAERTRIAREIHDTLAQGFVGVSTQLELTAHLLAQSHVREASEQVDRTRSLVREGLAEARRSIWNLRATGAQATLPARMTRLVDQNSTGELKPTINIGGTYRALAPALENEVLRIAQEALANVVRHSRATRVQLDLRYHPNELTLTVADNGVGFHADPTLPAKGHFGLQGMRERSDQIGGKLNVESSPQSGTTVTLHLPLANERE